MIQDCHLETPVPPKKLVEEVLRGNPDSPLERLHQLAVKAFLAHGYREAGQQAWAKSYVTRIYNITKRAGAPLPCPIEAQKDMQTAVVSESSLSYCELDELLLKRLQNKEERGHSLLCIQQLLKIDPHRGPSLFLDGCSRAVTGVQPNGSNWGLIGWIYGRHIEQADFAQLLETPETFDRVSAWLAEACGQERVLGMVAPVLTQSLLEKDRITEALTLAKTARHVPDMLVAKGLDKATTLIQQEKFTEASDLLELLRKASPQKEIGRLLLLSLRRQNRFDDAFELLSSLEDTDAFGEEQALILAKIANPEEIWIKEIDQTSNELRTKLAAAETALTRAVEGPAPVARYLLGVAKLLDKTSVARTQAVELFDGAILQGVQEPLRTRAMLYGALGRLLTFNPEEIPTAAGIFEKCTQENRWDEIPIWMLKQAIRITQLHPEHSDPLIQWASQHVAEVLEPLISNGELLAYSPAMRQHVMQVAKTKPVFQRWNLLQQVFEYVQPQEDTALCAQLWDEMLATSQGHPDMQDALLEQLLNPERYRDVWSEDQARQKRIELLVQRGLKEEAVTEIWNRINQAIAAFDKSPTPTARNVVLQLLEQLESVAGASEKIVEIRNRFQMKQPVAPKSAMAIIQERLQRFPGLVRVFFVACSDISNQTCTEVERMFEANFANVRVLIDHASKHKSHSGSTLKQRVLSHDIIVLSRVVQGSETGAIIRDNAKGKILEIAMKNNQEDILETMENALLRWVKANP